MIARPTRWIASPVLLFLAAGVAFAIAITPLTLGSLSITTAQVGVPYTATIQAFGGVVPYTYSIPAGALPDGLHFDNPVNPEGPMTISGTPTTAGTYNFTVHVTDSAFVPTFAPGPDTQAAASRRGLAQSGRNAAGPSNDFAITVSAAAVGAASAPTSPWTLAMVMVGLAGAGFWRLRRTRRA
jgi:Putative Ig domain